MILSKTSNNNWTPTAGGTGTFIGTLAAFNAIKDTLPVNTVAYITDDGNGDLQPIDAITNGDMHPVTSNAVYDTLNTVETIPITPNSHVTSGTITCKKCGHYVEVNLQNVVTDLTDYNTVFASGFPKPALNVPFNCFTVHAMGVGVIGSVNINQSGDMDTAWPERAESSQYVTYQGSFTYLSAD